MPDLTSSPPSGASAALQQLREALIREKRERTSPQDARNARLIVQAALARIAPGSDLQQRIARCGWRDDRGNRHPCKRPACPTCARWAGRLYFRKVLKPALIGVPVERLRWVTVLHHLAVDLDEGMARMRQREDRALRAIVKSYHGVRWWGVREIEILRPSDWSQFSPTRRALLDHMGFPHEADRVFLFHTHSLAEGSPGSLDDLGAELRERWAGTRQVQVQRLMSNRNVMESIRRIASYTNKARFTRDVGGDRREWLSDEEIAELALFQHRVSRGWQAFRFTINV